MSRQTFIFVGAPARDHDLIRLVEHALGASFRHEEGSDPYVRVGSTAVYLGAHEFDDDDIAWPGGPDIPLRSDYRAMLEIRDMGGDQQRQQAIGGQLCRRLRRRSRHDVPDCGYPCSPRPHRHVPVLGDRKRL